MQFAQPASGPVGADLAQATIQRGDSTDAFLKRHDCVVLKSVPARLGRAKPDAIRGADGPLERAPEVAGLPVILEGGVRRCDAQRASPGAQKSRSCWASGPAARKPARQRPHHPPTAADTNNFEKCLHREMYAAALRDKKRHLLIDTGWFVFALGSRTNETI